MAVIEANKETQIHVALFIHGLWIVTRKLIIFLFVKFFPFFRFQFLVFQYGVGS